MDLPIKFPSDADVIQEEVARFRALPPEQRIETIKDIISVGLLMIRQSPKAAFLHEYTQKQEELARIAIREFIARHGT
jgi:hypothetical protein